MNKKWSNILKVNLLKSDIHAWGEYPIKRIKQSFLLQDDTELPRIKKFVQDEIKVLNVQITHYQKWSPVVYHENTYASLQLEKRTLEIILKRL